MLKTFRVFHLSFSQVRRYTVLNSQHLTFSFWNLPSEPLGGREVALPCCAKLTSVSFVMFTIVGKLKGIVGASAIEDTTELAGDGSVILLTYSLNKQCNVVNWKENSSIISTAVIKELTQWQRHCILYTMPLRGCVGVGLHNCDPIWEKRA